MRQTLTVGDYKRNPEIRNTRRILLVILSILSVLTIIYSILHLISVVSQHHESNKNVQGSSTGIYAADIFFATMVTAYWIAFIKTVIKYLRTSILIFAWSCVIGLIIIPIILIWTIRGIANLFSERNNRGIETDIRMIVIIVCTSCILLIPTIILSFRLAKLMKTPETH